MKKLLMLLAVAVFMLGITGQAMAYFEDSRLIRVVYDRGGNWEVVTDLGEGWDFTSPTTVNHLFNTNTFSLSDLQISSWSNVYVAYFMRDVLMGASEVWTSGPLTGQKNAARQFSAYGTAYGNLAAFNQRTESPHNVNPQDLPNQSYNMTMGEQGRFSSFLPVGTQSPGDASLAHFDAPGIQFVDQNLYYYANPNASGPGLAVYTIRTWENGTTEINPIPIPGAFYLLGSGLLGLIGIRRRMMK